MPTNNNLCCDCRVQEGVKRVFEFGEFDGKPAMMCEDCYEEHENNGDWCS